MEAKGKQSLRETGRERALWHRFCSVTARSVTTLVCVLLFGGGFQEDTVLLAHVNRALSEAGCDDDETAMGAEAWKAVADSIPGRTAKQCRERFV